MLRKITLSTELEVMAVPPLALLSVVEVALAMMTAAIHCEHLDLNDIPRYFADDCHPPKSLILAQTICDRSEELINILNAYRMAIDTEINRMKYAADLPF